MSRVPTTPGSPVVHTPTGTTTPTRPVIPHERIAKLAYEKWLQGGCQHGCDLQNWFEAEMELMKAAGYQPPTTTQRR
ncbi:MAG: DUF2934 domain-containing protein [Gemmataceae bacterium]|nr:DUF2934 domain-containing protein [Gemmataceae bacterium]